MVSHHEFTHGADFAERISAAGFRWSQAGENIATGYPTPTSVVAGWMGARATARTSSTRRSGMSARASAGARRCSRPATWTQDFGLLMGQRAPSGNRGPAGGCPY